MIGLMAGIVALWYWKRRKKLDFKWSE